MTNQEKFIQIFGKNVWQQMIGLADQFKEFWTSPYNVEPQKSEGEE